MVASLIRSKQPITTAAFSKITDLYPLRLTDVAAYLNEFMRRGYMDEGDGEYTLRPPLFRDWLRHVGFSLLIADKLAEELEARMLDAEQLAYVTPQEIRELIDSGGRIKANGYPANSFEAGLNRSKVFSNNVFCLSFFRTFGFFAKQSCATNSRRCIDLSHNAFQYSYNA